MNTFFAALTLAAVPGFAAPPPVPPPSGAASQSNDLQLVLRFCKELRAALNRQEAAATAEISDFERFTAEVVELRAGKAAAIRGVDAAALMKKFLTLNGEGRSKIDVVHPQRISFTPDRQEAMGVFRFFGKGSEPFSARVWIRRKGDRFLFFDFEELPVGMRLSFQAALEVAQKDLSATPRERQAANDLYQTTQILNSQGAPTDDARKLLRSLPFGPLPAPLQGLRELIAAQLLMELQRPSKVIAACRKAETLLPTTPSIVVLQIEANVQLNRHAEALEAIEKYESLAGGDDYIYAARGESLLGLKRFREAADAFRNGLRENYGSLENLRGLAEALPLGKKTELADWLKDYHDGGGDVLPLVEGFLEVKDAEVLEVLAEFVRRQLNDAAQADFISAAAMRLRARYAEAAALLKKHLPNDEAVVGNVLPLFLDVKADQGEVIEGYRAAPTPRRAFAYLAEEMLEASQYDSLAALLAAHRKRCPDDENLTYFAAKLSLRNGKPAEALSILGAAKKTPPKSILGLLIPGTTPPKRSAKRAPKGETEQQSTISLWAEAAYKAGKALPALREIQPRDEAFAKLALLAATDRNADALASLVAEQRKDFPKDESLVGWDAEVLWLRKDYAKLVDASRKTPALLEGGSRLRDPFIRALIRLKRFDEARKVAEAYRNSEADEPLYTAIVEAVAGRPAEAERAIVDCLEIGKTAAELNEDEDLGPALAAPALAALRRKYFDADGLDP